MAVQLSDLESELRRMNKRLERLEAEVAALQAKVRRAGEATHDAVDSSPIVARYIIRDEEYIITQADLDRVRAETAVEGPIDKYTERDWLVVILAEKMAERRKDESPEAGYQRFIDNLEAARAKIIAEGKGIYDEHEAAIGD